MNSYDVGALALVAGVRIWLASTIRTLLLEATAIGLLSRILRLIFDGLDLKRGASMLHLLKTYQLSGILEVVEGDKPVVMIVANPGTGTVLRFAKISLSEVAISGKDIS